MQIVFEVVPHWTDTTDTYLRQAMTSVICGRSFGSCCESWEGSFIKMEIKPAFARQNTPMNGCQ